MINLRPTKPTLPIPTKIMIKREDRPRKSNPEGNSREEEDNNENPDIFDNKDDDEVCAEVPIDEIEILKSHIEA
jgi:hypothetical protein